MSSSRQRAGEGRAIARWDTARGETWSTFGALAPDRSDVTAGFALCFVLSKIAEPLALIALPIYLAYLFVLAPVGGVIMARIYLDDDMMAGTGIVSAIMTVKDNLGPSVMYLVTMLVVGLVAGVMGFVPLVGGMFAAAFQAAAGGIAIVQFRQALGGR